MKNDHLELEPFVECTDCGRKLHQICCLHVENIWPQGFRCEHCLNTKSEDKNLNKFNAKMLPKTRLGTYIENGVNNYLKKNEAWEGDVTIRVLSSSLKQFQVQPEMRKKFVENGQFPEYFPYRAKAIFAFQEIDGVDVCFFGMHVQEYGSDCPAPNTRRVYIQYIDSVHYFKPRMYRTRAYTEMILSYLNYVKNLGYTMAHIWACPPSGGDDYIFHCHPQEQKIPKPKMLSDWYKKILNKGIVDSIVLGYKDILVQAKEDNLNSVAELPYFEGDFWPNELEKNIKLLDEKEAKKQQSEAVANAIYSLQEGNVIDGKKKAKKSKNNLLDQIFLAMKIYKNEFFVIRLHSAQSAASLNPIQDPDPFINCDLMNGREAFLTMARKKNYEFSSLRRAKFSTISLLHELHNQVREAARQQVPQGYPGKVAPSQQQVMPPPRGIQPVPGPSLISMDQWQQRCPGQVNMKKEVLKLFLQALKNPMPDQHQIVRILKTNPPLMAIFIKQQAIQQAQKQRAGSVGGQQHPGWSVPAADSLSPPSTAAAATKTTTAAATVPSRWILRGCGKLAGPADDEAPASHPLSLAETLPRPVPSPRSRPSPTMDMMLSHISYHQSPAQQDPNDLTPQDQLSKFVEQL